MPNSEHARLMAAAVYEIRHLLSDHLGTECDSDPCLRLAAHLAYALHNDALAVLERDEAFDLEAARKRIRSAESIVGDTYPGGLTFGTGPIVSSTPWQLLRYSRDHTEKWIIIGRSAYWGIEPFDNE